MKNIAGIIVLIHLLLANNSLNGQNQSLGYKRDSILYQSTFKNEKTVKDWIMEGKGKLYFNGGWMHMYSPSESGHHVLWCPMEIPGNFIAEWEMQNLKTDAGLCIVFFSAKAKTGKDIFNSEIPSRNGRFRQYTKSKYFNNYHISYYANAKDKPGREISHLRKNTGFKKVQVGEPGIPIESKNIHKISLVKKHDHIIMFVDDRKIIDWKDESDDQNVWQEGRIGLRQMKWTHFRYRNFKVWELIKN
ncbi:DUF1961 family protein [Marinifilum caeruleilacunae]|uniref:DUF1961 family protein n=1 Tax=Marinifilum caeruleilacunae TaxID=2499076 RepID=A0ABX1WYV6_9BACT|nr:DUF1961 family protein [Marinifilum caeruleilacunae]NOU61289.1 DUF1961 family protein [Marinifilum caeruleilacunae]